MLGDQVWVKLVDADTPAPTDPAALTFLTMSARRMYRHDTLQVIDQRDILKSGAALLLACPMRLETNDGD